MPEKLMRCFRKVKTQLRKQNSKWSSKRVSRVARAICVKQTGLSFNHSEIDAITPFGVTFTESGKVEGINFSFLTPVRVVEHSEVQEKRPDLVIDDPDSVIVTGTAVYPTTSTNLNLYLEKELQKAVKTMKGIPCQVDHSTSARDTFGAVIDNWWDKEKNEVAYIAELQGDDPMTPKVRKGYVAKVSISGFAKTVECSICGKEMSWDHEHQIGKKYSGEKAKAVPKNITFHHLGFTPFPGIAGANAEYVPVTLAEAMDNAVAVIGHRMGETIEEQGITGGNLGSPGAVIGESAMPDEQKNLKEIERLKLKLEESQKAGKQLEDATKTNEKLKNQLEEARKLNKQRTVAEIVEMEIGLERIEKDKSAVKTEELMKESQTVLDAKLSVLKEWQASRPAPKATGRLAQQLGGNRGRDFSEQKREYSDEWIKEAKMARLSHYLFGCQPSVSAVRTSKEWDSERKRWKMPLQEITG